MSIQWAGGRSTIVLRRCVLLLTVACVTFAIGVSPALASNGYSYSHSFGSFGSGAGQFSEPSAVAVSEGGATKGDVYVVDKGNKRVEYFTSEGTYVGEFNGTSATGTGTLTSGSSTIESVTTATGAFSVGQEISAPGLLPETTITAVKVGGVLEVSQPATASESASLAAHQFFSAPGGIAVDNSCQLQHKSGSECESFDPSNGDVYVIDTEHNAIDKFSPTGVYIGQLTEASGGEHLSELYGGLGMDSSGVVWVYRTTGEIDSFSHALVNAFLSKVMSPYKPSFGGFAVDSNDNLYVKTGPGQVAKLDSGGKSLIEEMDSGESTGIAVDLSSNEVLVDEAEGGAGTHVRAFSESGSPIARFEREGVHIGGALGIDSTSGILYVAEPFANEIDIFSPHPTPPPPNTDPVGAVTATSATLNGDLNPGGVTGGVGFYFSYNLGLRCFGAGSQTTTPGIASGSVDVPESTPVTGLQPNANYAVCFFAADEFGANSGPTVTFTTPPAKPSVDQQSTSGVTLTEATLEAQINPNNQPLTSCKFEYGETTTYGHELPCEPPSLEGYGDKPVSASIVGGLVSAETYHYRVVAVNATGPTEGPDQTFTTLPLAPTVALGEATAGTDTATVTFTATPQGGDTQYAVRYGTSTAYTAQVQGDAGHSRSAVPITVSVPELAPGTVYHFSVTVQNAGGEEATPDKTFTTREASSPPSEAPITTEEPPATVPLILAQPPTSPLMFAAMVFPTETGTTLSTSKPLTRAQKLSKALRACKKQPKRKRAACERHARRRYATSRKARR